MNRRPVASDQPGPPRRASDETDSVHPIVFPHPDQHAPTVSGSRTGISLAFSENSTSGDYS